jgi:hypothetical protein
MQECLNNEYKEDVKCLSNPFWCTIILTILLVATIFPVVGIHCYNSKSCPAYMDIVFLEIGVVTDFFIVIFIVIPCSTRIVLNCCYEVSEVKKAPKVPPKSKSPTTTFKSFSESLTKHSGNDTGRSKSLNYTENPLTSKEKVGRSRSRSKSDSEV